MSRQGADPGSGSDNASIGGSIVESLPGSIGWIIQKGGWASLPAGNLISQKPDPSESSTHRTYEYDWENRLVYVKVGEAEYRFEYDALGRLGARERLDTGPEGERFHYLYDRWNLVEKRDWNLYRQVPEEPLHNTSASNKAIRMESVVSTYFRASHDPDDIFLLRRKGNPSGCGAINPPEFGPAEYTSSNYFLLRDASYNVTTALNARGEVVERYDYDDFGVPIFLDPGGVPRTDSLIGNDILWQSMRWDAEVELYYMRNRWYDPYLGRFLTRDPIGAFGDPLNFGNGYTFPANNPWSYRDPWGLCGEGAVVQDWSPSTFQRRFLLSRYNRDLWRGAFVGGTFASAAQTNANTNVTNAQITGGLDAGRTAAIEYTDVASEFLVKEGAVSVASGGVVTGVRGVAAARAAAGTNNPGFFSRIRGRLFRRNNNGTPNVQVDESARIAAAQERTVPHIYDDALASGRGMGSTTSSSGIPSTCPTGPSMTLPNSTRGWRVGDPINNLTSAGNVPAWSTVRARYWKNKAHNNPNAYTPENLARMRNGRAPQRYNRETRSWESMELHHYPPQRDGGLFDVIEVWPDEHKALDYFRR